MAEVKKGVTTNTEVSTKQVTEVTLKENEVMLASLKASKNPNKVILEYVEHTVREDQGPNLAALFNEGDERWDTKPRYRRHYQSSEKSAAILGQLGITQEQLKNASEVPTVLNILNPTIVIGGKKERIVLQFNDGQSPDMGENALSIEDQAKKVINKSGLELFFHKNAQPIFQKSSIVLESKRNNNFIKSDMPLLSWDDLQALQLETADVNSAINQ